MCFFLGLYAGGLKCLVKGLEERQENRRFSMRTVEIGEVCRGKMIWQKRIIRCLCWLSMISTFCKEYNHADPHLFELTIYLLFSKAFTTIIKT